MRPKVKVTAVAAGCLAAGAIAGLAGAAASPSSHTTQTTTTSHLPGPGPWRGRGGPPGGPGPAVHEQAVVLNRAGTGFITVTEDSGTVQSLTGDQLVVKEGVGHVTYRTVTLTIPSGATVIRNFAQAKLSDLRKGDRVHVTQSSEGTTVMADNGAPAPGRGPGGPHWFGRPGGLPGAGGPGSAGPGGPPPPAA